MVYVSRWHMGEMNSPTDIRYLPNPNGGTD